MKRPLTLAVAALVAPITLALGIATAAAGSDVLSPASDTSSLSANCLAGNVTVGTADGYGGHLDADQINNASIIYRVSVDMNLPSRAAIVGLATAMQESRLHNLTVATDHDSLGLFQQRPSMGWGTPAQITDPVYASKKFYSKLTAISDWQTLPVTVAAQQVQVSAFPDAYAKWEPVATELTQTFVNAAANCVTDGGDGLPVDIADLPASFTLPATTPAPVVTAIAWALGQLGTPYHFGGTCRDPHSGNPSEECDCSSLMQQAYAHAGIGLPRVVAQQYRVGTPIYNLNQILPGDLLFIRGSDGSASVPGHVGMYIGDGLLVQAPHTGTVVKITKFSDWESGIMDIRRIVK